MAERPGFQQTQLDFTAHLRSPSSVASPIGIEDRRMVIYRELLFNNVNSFIENGFPVLRTLYSDEQWLTLSRSFFAQHQSSTPYFAHIAGEFLAFLQHEYEPTESDPAFMLELAHYEWVELALSIDENEINRDDINHNGDLLEESPVASPLVWSLAYHWPVHKISADFLPDEPPEQATHLMVYRDAEDNIGFIETNPVTARLMQLLTDEPGRSGRDYFAQIAQELQHPDPETVIQGGLQILLKWRSKDIVLGTQPLR